MKKILIIILMFTVISCEDKKPNVRQACAPLPVEDGYVLVKTRETDTTLRLPWPSHLIRRVKVDETDKGCDYIKSLSIDYGWYKGKLYAPPESLEKEIYKRKEQILVRVYFRGNYFLSEIRKSIQPLEKWKLDPALPHKKFPLMWYTRYRWDHPENPSQKSLSKAKQSPIWGIRNTRYKDVISDGPFMAYCSIPLLDKTNPNSRLENGFSHFGDSKCRGWITVEKNNAILRFMVDIWAFKGDYKNYHPISDINLIYDSLVEEFQSYMQEQ